MSFLQDYREYCKELEVPAAFHTFCSLVGLAALTRRRVWTYKGEYIRIYPNLYVVLVGPPGCGKNVAMEIVEDLLDRNKIALSAESVTREKLIMDINEQQAVLPFLPATDKYSIVSPYTILATELSEFLGAGGIGMISFLTDIYSRNIYHVRTKNKGNTEIKGPFLNLIAGTTPDWVTNYLKDDIISGGFSRRCLFLYASGREGSNPRPRVTPEMRAAWDRVVARSASVGKLAGEYKWTPAAEKFFDAWYPSRKRGSDQNTEGYYETKDIFLIKVAMLVAISDGDELVLDQHHFERALVLLGLAERDLARVFQGIGRNELNQISVKALDFLERAPIKEFVLKRLDGTEEKRRMRCMPFKQLKSLLWSSANGQDMDQVFSYLRESGKIEILEDVIEGVKKQFACLCKEV
jgi:hypothetical protein